MAKKVSFWAVNGKYGWWVNRRLNWEMSKLRGLKWQNANLEDWNEKWWNLEGEFYILA